MRAQFNYCPDKTAITALLGSPPSLAEQVDCDVVSLYRVLGFLIDDSLTFTPLLKECVGRARARFVELFHAAELGRFSVPILTEQVCLRIEPGIMYVAPLLVLAPNMVTTLDRLHAAWARDFLDANMRIMWDGTACGCSVVGPCVFQARLR